VSVTAIGLVRSGATFCATANAHHGEVLQGVFRDGQSTVPGLVSLPNPGLRSTAMFAPGGAELTVWPSWKRKARSACLAVLGPDVTGHLAVHSDIPVERGLGSSTADVVSTIIAAATSSGSPVRSEDVARLAVAVEKAADGTMFGSRAVLFASRHGYLLEDFGGPMPAVEVVGFDAGGAGVNTLSASYPPPYTAAEIATFAHLRELLRQAVIELSVKLLACVATTSAQINQRYVPNRAFDVVTAVGARTGALGHQVAHTGRVIGLLYDPAEPALDEQVRSARRQLGEAGYQRTYRFTTEAGQR
jgi:uncharacterized protein involved in propanediol utilization